MDFSSPLHFSPLFRHSLENRFRQHMKTDIRSSLLTVGGLGLLAMSATAQQSMQTAQPQRINGTAKHAGIYHVATGTWTRTQGATANVGPDIVYNNTADANFPGYGGCFMAFMRTVRSGLTRVNCPALPLPSAPTRSATLSTRLICTTALHPCLAP